jgi:hypothetical protein
MQGLEAFDGRFVEITAHASTQDNRIASGQPGDDRNPALR